jgi:AcrR family transcriptional regulator
MVTYAKAVSARRDPDATKVRILDALARLILRDGLAGVGINALAREAGADKVLIYRYFSDLDGAYRAFAERSDFWYSANDLLAGIDPARMTLADAIKLSLRRHAAEIRKRPVTLAVLAAEPANRTALVVALEDIRERRAGEITAWLATRYKIPRGLDIEAIAALLAAALNYLAARSRKIRIFSGVKIKSGADWERLLKAVDRLVDGVLKED